MAAAAHPVLFQRSGIKGVVHPYGNRMAGFSLKSVCIRVPVAMSPLLQCLTEANNNQQVCKAIPSLVQIILVSCLQRADACVAPI